MPFRSSTPPASTARTWSARASAAWSRRSSSSRPRSASTGSCSRARRPGGTTFPIPQRTLDLVARFPTLPPEEAFRLGVENALADETVAERPELVDEIFAYRLAHPPDMAGWQAQAAASLGFDAIGRLGEVRVPTLVMHGTGDHVVDVRNAPLLAEVIPGAQLELYDERGHLFFWEEPERVAHDLREFLL